jgi:MSHA biogenesis protein MshQ
VRFDNLAIPQGATIISAYIEVTAERTSNNRTNNIDINGHAIDDAPIFSGAGNNDRNISSRPLTTASTRWTVQRFVLNNTYQSPDISSLVQEVIDRPGWAQGNAMVFVMDAQNGNEKRVYAHDTFASRAPRLVIEYDDAGPQPGVCSDNVRDDFNVQSFNNDDGTIPWSAPWTEYDNAGAGPASGKVRVTGGRLRLDNYTGGEWNGNPGVDREVDISEYKTARLQFDYELLGGVDNADWFRVQVSSDGGATWDRTWDILNQRDGSYTFDEDITSSISANTVVSIRIYDEINAGTTACCYGGTNERIEIDFVEILAEDICDAVVEYRFEELSWNSTPGEVYNELGTGMDGRAYGGANTSNSAPPDSAITGDPGTCRFGQYDGVNGYVEVADDIRLDMTEAVTVTAWVHPESYKSSLMTILSKDENYEFHLNPDGTVNYWWNNASGITREFSSTSSAPLNTWTHVAIVYSQTEQVIYINGVASGSASYTNELLLTNSDPLQIGDDQNYSAGSRRFDGYIDEVRVYDFPVRSQDIPLIMMETHPCPLSPPLVGFNISFGAGSASTCTPLPVTISAVDSGGSVLTTYSGNVQINTQTAHGDWSAGGPDAPLSPVNNGGPDDGAATYQFVVGDGGSIDLLLTNTHADVLTVSVGDAVAGVTSISSPIAFRDNAFVITPVTCTGATCPGTGSTEVVAGRDHIFNAALWRRDPTTGNCAIATGYDTGANAAYGDLKAWVMRDIADPAGVAPTIGAGVLGSAAPAANNIDLNFSSGQAQFTLSTTDVGKYSINLRDDTSGFAKDDRGTADTSDDLPIHLDGSSSTLTTRPLALGFTNIQQGALANPGGTATTGSKFVAAGETFESTVGAYLWQAGDDADNNGVIDDPFTIDVTDNGITPAYDFLTEVTADTTAGSFTPAPPGVAGVVGGTTSVTGFTTGLRAVNDLTYSEVGSMRLLANANDFLGTAGVNVTGNSPVVGRFYPHHFEVTAVVISPASAANGFTYMDQPELGLQYTIQAHRLGSGVTRNYFTGGYNVGTSVLVAEDNNDGVDLSSRLSNLVGTNWVAGEYVVNNPAVQFDRDTAPDGPFNTLALGVQVSDPDGAQLLNMDMNPSDATNCAAASSCTASSLGTTQMLYGRAVLRNAYGREDLPLPLVYETEYFDGTQFINNSTADSDNTAYDAGRLTCSDAYLADTLVCGDVTETGIGIRPANSFTLSAPNKRGRLKYLLDVDNWLEYDWNGDGTDVDPEALATFGLRGDDRFIHWRETE